MIINGMINPFIQTEITRGSAITPTSVYVPKINFNNNNKNGASEMRNINDVDYDKDTINAMMEMLLQKKAELDDIESRWKKDADFNNGDVIVVDYAYSTDEDAKVYTGALLKTPVGWFTTLETALLGVNKYSQVVKFFENRCVKKVTYLALSEGVEMFSNVGDDDADVAAIVSEL